MILRGLEQTEMTGRGGAAVESGREINPIARTPDTRVIGDIKFWPKRDF